MTSARTPVTYGRIRRAHFRKGLAAIVKGLDKTTIVLGCVLGPGVVLLFVGLLVGISAHLGSLTDPSSSLLSRIVAVVMWQTVMFGFLWAMRNVLFMRQADAFFASLPISRRAVLGMDIALAARCCSLLWLPVIWLLSSTIVAKPATEGVLAFLGLGILALSALVSNVLVLRKRYVPALAAVLPTMAITAFVPLSVYGILAGLVSTAFALRIIEKYIGSRKVERSSRLPGHQIYDRVAIASGMTLLFLAHDLREAATVRAVTISAAFALASLTVHWRGPGPQIAMATMTCLCCLLATLLYRLPETIKRVTSEHMAFLAGQSRFRRRVGTYAIVVPSLVFATAVMLAYVFVLSEVPGSSAIDEGLITPISTFAGLYALGVLGSLRWLEFVIWFMPVANVTTALIILMSRLT